MTGLDLTDIRLAFREWGGEFEAADQIVDLLLDALRRRPQDLEIMNSWLRRDIADVVRSAVKDFKLELDSLLDFQAVQAEVEAESES